MPNRRSSWTPATDGSPNWRSRLARQAIDTGPGNPEETIGLPRALESPKASGIKWYFTVLSNREKVEAPKPLGEGLQRLRPLSRAHSASGPAPTSARKRLCG